MFEIRIVPPHDAAYAANREDYVALREALERAGYQATVEIPPHERGVEHLPTLMEIAVHVGETVVARQLTEMLKSWLGARRRQRPTEEDSKERVVIYGPDGAILSTVEVPEADD